MGESSAEQIAARAAPTRAPVDVLIQTYNEEFNLPYTLSSVADWTNRVFVVDSGSTDRTVEIARSYGAQVVSHTWEGYATQKNWALDNLPFESPWILILDADESISPELRQEIQALTAHPAESVSASGFQINRVFVFMDRQIRHCGYFPSWNVRLFKRGKAHYEQRLVHEHMVVDGQIGYLRHLLIHEDRRGLEHFFAKHNRYSTLEARELYESQEPWPGIRRMCTDRVVRRRFVKSRVLPYLPLPWTWRLIYMYVLRLGVLDGKAGWVLSNFISSYEFFIQTKYQELRRLHGRQLSVTALSEPEGQLSFEHETGIPRFREAPQHSEPQAARHLLADVAPGPAATIGFEIPSLRKTVQEQDRPQPSVGTVIFDTARRHPQQETNRVPVSVMIPTLNEAANLPRCLDHLRWADEVVVIDSGSGDDTVKIAQAYGANVVNFQWDGKWPKKKNWALRHAPFKHEWILIVDADEWITPELANEIRRTIRNPDAAGYYINRRFIFMGSWIKHCGYYPSWNLRLLRRGLGEYEQLTGIGNTGSGDNEVHEHVIPVGPVGYLQHDMLHFAFPNIHTFMEKHNRYSNWEAAVQYQKADTTSAAIGEKLSRRRRLKNFSRYLPLRPTLRFLYAYVWRGGILDGKPGYIFCRLLSIYEYLSVAKYAELCRAQRDRLRAGGLSNVPALDWQTALGPIDQPGSAPRTNGADQGAASDADQSAPADAPGAVVPALRQ